MELLKIKVEITDVVEVVGEDTVRMVSFTGSCCGDYFNGRILPGGVDTQTIHKDGNGTLSARYMMEGTDLTGARCRVYIENNAKTVAGVCERTYPRITTDSPALRKLLRGDLYGMVEPHDDGIVISIHLP